jgi:hypothetical protein
MSYNARHTFNRRAGAIFQIGNNVDTGRYTIVWITPHAFAQLSIR